jgi:hypothetical protein
MRSRVAHVVLAVVEELRGTIDVSQHEAAPAKVAGFRVGHGQYQGACHGCINGVAPGGQDARGDVGTERVRHCDGAAQPRRRGNGCGDLPRRELPAQAASTATKAISSERRSGFMRNASRWPEPEC